MSLEDKVEFLKRILKELGSVAVALSGGLDSSFLLYYASRVLDSSNVVAVTVDFPYIHRRSIRYARETAEYVGVKHVVVRDNEVMKIHDIMINSRLRCYYCKKRMFKLVWSVAREEKLNAVIDGTNKTDFSENRPGIKALIEEKVASPLATAGLSKDDIEKLVLRENLPFINRAPNTCLLTRIPYNSLVLSDDLKRIEDAEEIITRELGVRFVRVRLYFDSARIEFYRSELLEALEKLINNRNLIKKIKNLGFKHVLVDCEGYRPS